MGDSADKLGALFVSLLKGLMSKGVLQSNRTLLGNRQDKIGVAGGETVRLVGIDPQYA
jgi:hypothetical protein